MKSIFITGTDTGVGKTVVTGLLARYLISKGCLAVTQKWVQTGSRQSIGDIDVHLRLMGKKRKDVEPYLSSISPYIFKFPSSPNLAAKLEKRNINVNKIKKSFRFLARKFDSVIVEGVGGALVPINNKKLVIDIAKDLKLPVLIVVSNKLGAINHTLLTIEAVKRRKMKIIGIILNNQSVRSNTIILKDNPKIIRSLTGEKILGILPNLRNKESLYKKFILIGNKIA